MGFLLERRANVERLVRVVISSGRDHVKLRAKLTVHFGEPQTPAVANAAADVCESRVASVLRQAEHHEHLLGHEADIADHARSGVSAEAHVRALEVDLCVAGTFASSATRRRPSDGAIAAVGRAQTAERAASAGAQLSATTTSRRVGRFDRAPMRFAEAMRPVVESALAALAVSCLLSDGALGDSWRGAGGQGATEEALWHEARCAVTSLALLALLAEGCPQANAIEVVEALGRPVSSADMARYLAAPDPLEELTCALERILLSPPRAPALAGELGRIKRDLTAAIRTIGGPSA